MGINFIKDSLFINYLRPFKPLSFGYKVTFLEDTSLYSLLKEDKGDFLSHFI